MKLNKVWKFLLCMMLLVSVLALIACRGNNPDNPENPENPPVEDGGDNNDPPSGQDKTLQEKYAHITIAEAIALANAAGETPTIETYTIVGTIVTVSNATYGEMTVADSTGELYIYGSMASDGTYYDKMTEKPVKGDEVVLTGVLMAYNGTPQMAAKNQKATIVDWVHTDVVIDASEYPAVSISEAREKATGEKVKVDGVVAAITYSTGVKPCGVILVDEGASIYVYSGDVAAQVSVGNKIEVAASKTYWVLGTEQSNAALYGYKGACQLEEAILVSNDKGTHSFDTSWIEDITVKALLNTSVEENITTLLFKTTALIEKREGTGFTNYYINDLDGVTGSYSYSQSNGDDFAWLAPYDGKICTVYFTALNAKSTASGCFFRLLPVMVEEIADFVYPEEEIPAFAIEYAVKDLFEKAVYGSNPAIQLPNSYSNAHIHASGITFSYAVSDPALAELVVGDSHTILNLIAEGTVEVSITATYQGHSHTVKQTIMLDPVSEIETPTIAEVIGMEDGSHVIVRGVVISSLVNRSGFYIGDATGMIAVLTTGEVLGEIKPGDEIVMEGYKIHFKGDYTNDSYVGQCTIVGSATVTKDDAGKITNIQYTADAKLLANYYGNHTYDTSYFIHDKTIDDLYHFAIDVDYTTNVYVVQAKVVVEGNAYYSNILLQDADGGDKLRLYCSNSSQYSWLKAYEGQVVEIELAVCNWNDKNYYTGCAISVTVDGVKVINELNFNN